ncbi:hypothetical protein BJY52DRAFT_636129 [Lactarius psammicola]|nr:hypothetical protein BJY52DRAFT_636129 [Lactarius psammicola]
MCLYGLWDLGTVLHRLGGSRPLPPEFLDLASLEVTRHIRTEKDQASRVLGRCVEASVVGNLAARIKSRTDSTVQISDEALTCLSAILGTESRDFRLWFGRPGAIELANMASLIFSETDSLFSNTTSSDELDMIQQMYNILSPTLPAELNAELMNFTDEASSYPIYGSRSRKFLKRLWYFARAYNQVSAPLPSSVCTSLARLEITRRIHTERNPAARVTKRCLGALIVNKLVDDFKSCISFSSGVYDAELACISSILGTGLSEVSRWPRPSTVIKLLNVVSLVSGEIETLFTSGPTPEDLLNMVQQTINIISQELVLGSTFVCGDLPMDQVLLAARNMFENREHAARQSVQGPNGGNIRPTTTDIETTAYGGV